MRSPIPVSLASFGMLFVADALPAQSRAALPPRTTSHEIAALPLSRYYLVEEEDPPPAAKARGLLVVLPGGDGSSEFLPFVARSIAECTPPGFLCAMLAAPKWTPDQEIVWPGTKRPAEGMKYTTDEYVQAVLADVGAKHALDRAKLVVLAWSSSGPAIHDLLASGKSPFTRGYVAMSVFPHKDAKAVAATKGMRIVLDQSRDDERTPFSHAERARDVLGEAGAVVRLMAHGGEHGWVEDPLPRVTEGLRWLLSQEPVPSAERKSPDPVKVGKNLLRNGTFEDGTNGWAAVDNSRRLGVEADSDPVREGKKSMHVSKSGPLPLDLVRQEFTIPGDGRITFRAWVKAKNATNSFVKVWLYDARDRKVSDQVDVVHLRGNKEWQRVEKTWDATGAVRGEVQIVMVGPGEVWIDAAEALFAK